MQGEVGRLRVELEGRPAPTGTGTIRASSTSAGPGYFQTAGVPLVAGREFVERDGAGVAILNRRMAKVLWGGRTDVIGGRLRVGSDGGWLSVVGVVADTRQVLMREPFPEIFLPYQQDSPASVVLVIGTRVPAAALAGPVRKVLQGVDPDLPFSGLRSFDDLRRDYIPPVYAAALGAFSLLALALVSVGLYGLLSFYVVESTREIGMRVALGASVWNVLALVVGQGVRLAAVGLVIGLAGAVAVGRALSALLPAFIRPLDAGVLLAVPASLLAVAVAASLIPAWRAVLLDPAVSLRRQ